MCRDLSMANGWIYDKPGGWGSEEWGINNRTQPNAWGRLPL